ncbi:MAG: YraN family protein [Pseudomonadota bacterium]
MVSSHRDKGDYGECLALEFLSDNGLILVSRNYRCRLGEVDIIMQDKSELVFVEVKYRESKQICPAVDLVGPMKQRRLIRAAKHFITQHPMYQECIARFDVVGISRHNRSTEVEWIQDAFETV